jgi:phage tail-like protein
MAVEPNIAMRWHLEMDGITDAYFKEVTGLTSESQVVEVTHAGPKGTNTIFKIPGNIKFSNITFSQGVTNNNQLYEWRKLVEDGKIQEARKNGTITLFAPDQSVVKRYHFFNGWPCKLEGPGFDSTKNEAAVQRMEIAVDKLTQE